MADFTMPNLGADMEAGTLVKWHVKVGDAVKRGQVIAEVDTAKGIIDIECFETGIVRSINIEPGSKIPVGTVMAVIATETEPAPPPATVTEGPLPARPHATPLARKIAADLGVNLAQITGTGPGGLIDRDDVETAAAAAAAPSAEKAGGVARVRMSPLARRRAAELGIDPATVAGTGPEGVIEIADIESAATARVVLPAAPGDAMRRAIAAAMAKSKREIPHYYLQARIDMSRALSWLEAENQRRSITARLLPAVLLLKAVARTLRDVPNLNGFWKEDRLQISSSIHLGFAIAMKGGGLVAPAIHDVDHLTCDEVMAALRDLIPRARTGRLRSSEMTDATVTVTSLGDLGVESVLGVIYPPQVALVGFGKVLEQPWAQDGLLGVRPVMMASLAGDHRATDGHIGAQFLDSLNKHLQAPEAL